MTTAVDSLVSPVTTPALVSGLERVLTNYFGHPRTVIDLDRRFSPYSSSYCLEILDVTLDGDQPLQLVFKDLSPDAVPAHARWIKPAFLVNPEREITAYRTAVPHTPPGGAVYYGAITNRTSRRHWLFLEYVNGTPLWQVGDLAVWEAAACWLGRLHAQKVKPEGPWLRYDAAYYRRWMRRIVHVMRRRDTSELDALGALINSFGHLVERLDVLPRAFIHGEFYASNVLFREGAPAWPICPVDWEMAAIGPALMDLSALTSGDWSREWQIAMATAYRDTMLDIQGYALGMEELLEGLDACRLMQSLQLLGWSLRWEPPEAQATDWLSEATALAEQFNY